jgi:hypothetical protein
MSEKKKPILVYVYDSEREKLEKEAEDDGRSLSDYCRRKLTA